MTIIKTTNGNVFGVFAENKWKVGYAVRDNEAFIISLINQENRPLKAKIEPSFDDPDLAWYSKNANYALYCSTKSGPTFGFNGYYKHLELFISSNSNANQKSKSNFGRYFKHPDYDHQTEKARNILAGSQYFQTIEIEVFTKGTGAV